MSDNCTVKTVLQVSAIGGGVISAGMSQGMKVSCLPFLLCPFRTNSHSGNMTLNVRKFSINSAARAAGIALRPASRGHRGKVHGDMRTGARWESICRGDHRALKIVDRWPPYSVPFDPLSLLAAGRAPSPAQAIVAGPSANRCETAESSTRAQAYTASR